MERDSAIYKRYIEILKKELIPAMGCTEPIAVAYCAAKAGDLLGTMPDLVEARFIDGKECLVVTVNDRVEVDGMNVRTIGMGGLENEENV